MSTVKTNSSLDAIAESLVASYGDGRCQHVGRSFIPSREEITKAVELLLGVLYPGFFGAQELSKDMLTEHVRVELGRALFLSPYDPEAHLLLGRIHLRAGRVHEAIDALKISLWSAESAAAHAVLAQAYLESGDRESARREADRAIAIDPSSPDARRASELIITK